LGLFAFRYYINSVIWKNQLKIWFSGNRKKALIKKLAIEKEELLDIFKSSHDEYLKNEK